MEPTRAFIQKIHLNNIKLQTCEHRLDFFLKPHEIKFRGKPAPRNLLQNNAEVLCTLKNNKITEAWIDGNLEINGGFMKLKSYSIQSKEVTFSDDAYLSQDIPLKNVISDETTSINEKDIESYFGKFAIVYFNKDIPIEARILKETLVNIYYLDELNKGQAKKNTEYIALHDDRLVPHQISKDFVFFKSNKKLFNRELVVKYIGVEVKVTTKMSQIFAEVQVDSKKVDKDLSEIKINELNISPVHGERLRTKSPEIFAKRVDYMEDSTILLLSLFEVSFRYPSWPGKAVLKEDLENLMIKCSNNNLNRVERIFELTRDYRAGTIEELYKIFKDNNKILQNCSQSMFLKPFNFNLISERFKVAVFVVDTSSNEWISHSPITFERKGFPTIYFKSAKNLRIVYSKAMMEFDGYDCETLFYKQPVEADLIFHAEEELKVSKVFECVLKIGEKISQTDEETFHVFHELVRNVKVLSLQVKKEERDEVSRIYEDLIKFNNCFLMKNSICQCGMNSSMKFQCGDHYLCEKCAFVSGRLGICIVCNTGFNGSASLGNLKCPKCGYIGEDLYFFGFLCRCIICTGCLYEIISKQAMVCFKKHELNKIDFIKGHEYIQLIYNLH